MRISSADNRGLMRKESKRLRVVVFSIRSQHQIRRGNCGGIVGNPDMKWFLNVTIEFYDSLVWSMFGGMS